VVVEVGLTDVEFEAEVEVKFPGVMAMLAAPEVDQLNVLLPPEAMLPGADANELIVGLLAGGFTVTVAVEVMEPEEFAAVSVKVVVAVGLTLVEPVAELEVNDPGVIAMPVAPLVAQFKVLLEPELMVVGVAAKDVTVGAEPVPVVALCLVALLQLAIAAQASRSTTRRARVVSPGKWEAVPRMPARCEELGKFKGNPPGALLAPV
jgi:hypothetical protein